MKYWYLLKYILEQIIKTNLSFVGYLYKIDIFLSELDWIKIPRVKYFQIKTEARLSILISLL